MMRVIAPCSALLRSALVQVGRRSRALDLGDRVCQGGRACERRILGEQRISGLPGSDDRLLVAQYPKCDETGPEARLGGAEHVALTTLLEVDAAELEAVGGRCHRVEALAGGGAELGVRDEKAEPGKPSPADAPAQLVEL